MPRPRRPMPRATRARTTQRARTGYLARVTRWPGCEHRALSMIEVERRECSYTWAGAAPSVPARTLSKQELQ